MGVGLPPTSPLVDCKAMPVHLFMPQPIAQSAAQRGRPAASGRSLPAVDQHDEPSDSGPPIDPRQTALRGGVTTLCFATGLLLAIDNVALDAA
jgi:hypothetical protein